MSTRTAYALLLIAACVVSTGVSAQKIYRCGATYSQIPCGAGKTLDTTATASTKSKQAADKENKRQLAAAKAMEKERLAAEAQAQKRYEAQLKTMEADKAKAAQAAKTGQQDSVALPLKGKKPPSFFTAKEIPESKP